jgi:hypothetical protein
MLGVRRAGVTAAPQSPRQRPLIETGRNQILVLNRSGIERAAGGSYGAPEKEHRRLIRLRAEPLRKPRPIGDLSRRVSAPSCAIL